MKTFHNAPRLNGVMLVKGALPLVDRRVEWMSGGGARLIFTSFASFYLQSTGQNRLSKSAYLGHALSKNQSTDHNSLPDQLID
jgi:hypothetical protein